MDKTVLQRRRRALMDLMDGGVAVVPTAPEHTRNRDVLFPFRPDSDFYYLSCFPEPAAVAVLAPGREQGEFILFCRERDAGAETWNGRRAGTDGARRRYHADQAFPIAQLDEVLPGILAGRDKIFCNTGRYPRFDARLVRSVERIRRDHRSGARAPFAFVELGHVLHEQRLLKQAEEVRVMKHAAHITAEAHCRALRCCRPGLMEYRLQAEIEHAFRSRGAAGPAYASIVAGGANGCILHYTDNNCELRDGEMVLIDAGAEVDCYASDITRTFPVNGRFSGEQRALYEIVLAAQHAAFEQVRPGVAVKQYDDAAIRVLTCGLVDLGLLSGAVDGLIEQQEYRHFYMHRTGHWLGMDVHDVGDYKVDDAWRALQPGMVLTVEPGLYITPGDGVAERWHNIAVRIEDNLLLTEDGHELLTGAAPSAMDEIEALMREAPANP